MGDRRASRARVTSVTDLEMEVAQMEDRLQAVKVAVDAERDAWKKSFKPTKHGTKWRGARTQGQTQAPKTPATATADGASTSNRPGSRQNSDGDTAMAGKIDDDEKLTDLDVTKGVPPSYWDALEVAQVLQTHQLTTYAKVVIYEQITGKLLLDTPPGRLRQLFQTPANDTSWQKFMVICSGLHKLQKRMEKAWLDKKSPAATKPTDGAASPHIATKDPVGALPSPRSSFFPQISPRAGDDNGITHVRTRTPMLLRKQSSNSVPLATCWNCGSRVPRSASIRASGRSKSQTLRSYCSKQCQQAIEGSEMAISAAMSVQFTPAVDGDAKNATAEPGHLTGLVRRSSKSFDTDRPPRPPSTQASPKAKRDATGDALDLLQASCSILQIGGQRGSTSELPRPPAGMRVTAPPNPRKRVVTGVPPSIRAQHAQGIPPLLLTNSLESSQQSRVFRQSVYKLDPDLFQARKVDFQMCFLVDTDAQIGTGCNSPTFLRTVRTNLARLQEFISLKCFYHLSLVSHAWFHLLHQSSVTDALWEFHLARMWKHTEKDDALLRDLGLLRKPERPKKTLMKLTRQVSRIVHDNIKSLVMTENWLLASPCQHHPLQSDLLTPTAYGRRSNAADLAELYEHISVIYNRLGEVVAVKAQELVRPVDENAVVTDILQGIRSNVLHQVECRRLRLFSPSNWLPFDLWHRLPHCRAVFEIYWTTGQSHSGVAAPARDCGVWHRKILEKMQKYMHNRLLSKESVQHVIKMIHERNGPHDTLVHLEHFLVAVMSRKKSTASVAPAPISTQNTALAALQVTSSALGTHRSSRKRLP